MSKEHKTLFKTFKTLLRYKTLAEQGRLLELPAPIGSTVWFVGKYYVTEYKIERIIINESGIDCIQVVREVNGKEWWDSFSLEEFNERFFRTIAEAEQALAERVGEINGQDNGC